MNPGFLALLSLFILVGAELTEPESAPQQQSDETKNLKYYPEGTKRSELIPQMRQFSFALGAPCTYCHGTEEQRTSDLRGVDFSLDIKPTKDKARQMLRMVDEINSRLLPQISQRREFDLEVTCFTCHSGLPFPESIEARVMRKIEDENLEAAIDDYRQVRERYYGSAAFNFKEQPLVEVASALHGEGQYEASAKISLLNLEFHPESGQSKFWLAEAYAASGERAKARELYEELLAQHPNDPRLKARIEALGKKDN
ncbi:MAG TPA: c-type cytochrome [Acidobacteriota bacterium]|nr:c-type cytochrome [Acidobacteriota bacterium]